MVRRLRRARGLTVYRLGHRGYVSPSHIFHLEAGWDLRPSREMVSNLAAGLELDGVDTARLLIAAGHWPWRMPDWAVTAFVEAVEDASAMGHDEAPAEVGSRTG
jgi:hypothetical protein